RTLGERGLLESIPGRVALGWLVVEDLFTVLALVLLPALAMAAGGGHAAGPAATGGRGSLVLTPGLAVGKNAVFVRLMFLPGARARALFPGSWSRWRARARGSSSSWPCWRRRWAWRLSRPRCSGYR